MTAILLSVKPVYARAILAGTKTAEVRRRFPEQPEGTLLVIYSTSPERAILGTARLRSIERPATTDVWRLFKHRIQIDRRALDAYLDARPSASILSVSDPELWDRLVPLADLRRLLGIEPPQSFRYLTDEQVSAISPAAACYSPLQELRALAR